MSAGDGHLHYARHFTLLAAVAALLVAVNRWVAAPRAAGAFALYGALHASMVAVSLRGRPSAVQQTLFIALAAVCSLAIASLALHEIPLAAQVRGYSGVMGLLAACSAAGALVYGSLVRRFWPEIFPRAALAASAILCTVATYAGSLAAMRLQGPGSLWLAIPWWFAFSASLWYHDPRSPRGIRS